jgi:hypothetical protein
VMNLERPSRPFNIMTEEGQQNLRYNKYFYLLLQ